MIVFEIEGTHPQRLNIGWRTGTRIKGEIVGSAEGQTPMSNWH